MDGAAAFDDWQVEEWFFTDVLVSLCTVVKKLTNTLKNVRIL